MFVIISKILFRIKKIYLIRQIRLPNLTIYEDKKMKLLESAKNLKKSCYIYFFDSKKKFNITNEHVTNYEASKRCVYATLYHNWFGKVARFSIKV